jgi:NADPH:quinone reductase-like Zn-dependent oxidoreductase
MATMKALQITKVHESQLITMDRSEAGPNEVLIKVMASGICGTDIHIIEGGFVADYPVISGHEFAGIAEHVEMPSPGFSLETMLRWNRILPVTIAAIVSIINKTFVRIGRLSA